MEFSVSGTLASMGNGLPYSLGAAHGLSGTADRLYRGRRRIYDVDGRIGHAGEVCPSRQNHRAEKQSVSA